MFDQILERMRKLVRYGEYVVTDHALEAMEDDALTVFDHLLPLRLQAHDLRCSHRIVRRRPDARPGQRLFGGLGLPR